MVTFADYSMPLNYRDGIIKEHQYTRSHAGLFDVSHMGQISVRGQNAATWLETLMPIDVINLPVGRQRYGLLLNEQGGVIDDLMVIRCHQGQFILVVNAACKDNDFNHLQTRLENRLEINMDRGSSMLALQGPVSAQVMESLGQSVHDMKFMDYREMVIDNVHCRVSRSGYTGEDGFEFLVSNSDAGKLADLLLDHDRVRWSGLGARDSLRLEAGLNLYGHEMTESITPIESGLLWAISKTRRTGGDRQGGFPGADKILSQIPHNVTRTLVGLRPDGRAPVRHEAVIEDADGNRVGTVTSGGFSPSLEGPVCLALVDTGFASIHTRLYAVVRHRRLPVEVTNLPFIPHRYYRH